MIIKVSKLITSLCKKNGHLYDQNTSKGLDLTQSYDGGYIIAGFKYEDNDYNKQRALLIRLGSDETPIDEPVEYNGPLWYVSTSGSGDNDGSENYPFNSIQNAINLADNGDTIIVNQYLQ